MAAKAKTKAPSKAARISVSPPVEKLSALQQERTRKEQEARWQRERTKDEQREARKEERRQAANKEFQERVASARKEYLSQQLRQQDVTDPTNWGPQAGTYDPMMGERICQLMVTSRLGLREICELPGMPTVTRVLRWVKDFPGFAVEYYLAREMRGDLLADECLVIADNVLIGEKTTISEKDGMAIVRADMIDHRRLQVEVRRWMAGVLNPTRYGSRVAVTGHREAPPLFPDALPPTLEEAMRVYIDFARGKLIEGHAEVVEEGA